MKVSHGYNSPRINDLERKLEEIYKKKVDAYFKSNKQEGQKLLKEEELIKQEIEELKNGLEY